MKRLRIVVLAIWVVMLLLWLMSREWMQPDIYDWHPMYSVESRQPFGLNLLKRQADRYFESVRLEDGMIEPESGYLYINRFYQPDSVESVRFLEQIELGMTAFIAAEYVGTRVMDALNGESLRLNFEMRIDSGVVLGDGVSIPWWEEGRKAVGPFARIKQGVHALILDTDEQDGVVFTVYPYGKGYVYIHTVPIVFTNVQLLEERVFDYVEWVFRHIPSGRVVWDIRNKSGGMPAGSWETPGRKLAGDRPFRYILSQPALATSFYILLAGGILYLIFGSKRKMRKLS
jgi:hypothetical protein